MLTVTQIEEKIIEVTTAITRTRDVQKDEADLKAFEALVQAWNADLNPSVEKLAKDAKDKRDGDLQTPSLAHMAVENKKLETFKQSLKGLKGQYNFSEKDGKLGGFPSIEPYIKKNSPEHAKLRDGLSRASERAVLEFETFMKQRGFLRKVADFFNGNRKVYRDYQNFLQKDVFSKFDPEAPQGDNAHAHIQTIIVQFHQKMAEYAKKGSTAPFLEILKAQKNVLIQAYEDHTSGLLERMIRIKDAEYKQIEAEVKALESEKEQLPQKMKALEEAVLKFKEAVTPKPEVKPEPPKEETADSEQSDKDKNKKKEAKKGKEIKEEKKEKRKGKNETPVAEAEAAPVESSTKEEKKPEEPGVFTKVKNFLFGDKKEEAKETVEPPTAPQETELAVVVEVKEEKKDETEKQKKPQSESDKRLEKLSSELSVMEEKVSKMLQQQIEANGTASPLTVDKSKDAIVAAVEDHAQATMSGTTTPAAQTARQNSTGTPAAPAAKTPAPVATPTPADPPKADTPWYKRLFK